jgi:cobalt-zinc-cadmium efflux system outer membrane protein
LGATDRDQLLDLAVERNPEIRAALAELRGASGRVAQARLWPNPEFEIEQSDLRYREGRTMSEVALAQALPIGGRVASARRLADAEAALVATTTEARIRSVLGEVDRLHLELLYHHADLASQFELLDEAEATLAAAEQARSAGRATAQEVLKARVERDRLTLEVTRHSAERVYTLQQLSVALGGVDTFRMRLTGGLEYDYAVLGESGDLVWLHPEYRAADLAVTVAERRIDAYRRERIPDLVVRIGAGYDDSENDTAPFAGIRIAIPAFDRLQGRIHEAKSALVAAEAEREAVRLRLENAVRKNAQYLSEYDTFVHEYRESVLPDAKRALGDARARYAEGETSFIDLIDAQRVYTEVRMLYFQYLRLYNEALTVRRALEGYPQESRINPSQSPATPRSLP